MQVFLKFMGWLILYSLLYFLVLDITGHGPDMKDAPGFIRTLNFYLMPLIALPLWWFSWKKFETAFGPREPRHTQDGITCTFALRNPALMYYLMVLKLFLLAMGANGIITLSHHGRGAQIFYIINFIVLYIYALPFFIIKYGKLRKALHACVTAGDSAISLAIKGRQPLTIAYADAQAVLLQQDPPALCVAGEQGAVVLGSPKARLSAFYVPGLERVIDMVREKAGTTELVSGMKPAMKERGIKPLL
jgi:hypothetical protein